jgi:hypothetical protein
MNGAGGEMGALISPPELSFETKSISASVEFIENSRLPQWPGNAEWPRVR